MNLSYDVSTRLFTVFQNNRVLDTDFDGVVLALRYGFINEAMESGTQPELNPIDYEEYASYSYSYVKPASTPGIEGFLFCDEEPKEYCW